MLLHANDNVVEEWLGVKETVSGWRMLLRKSVSRNEKEVLI